MAGRAATWPLARHTDGVPPGIDEGCLLTGQQTPVDMNGKPTRSVLEHHHF